MIAARPPVSEARRAEAIRVMEQYRPLMLKFVGWARKRWRQLDGEELLNVLRWEAYQTAMRWRPDGGANMTTYLYHALRGAAYGYVADLRRDFMPSLDEPVGKKKDGTLAELIPAREEPEKEDDEWDVLTAGLRPEERDILRLRFDDGLSFDQIAVRLGLPRPRVSKIYHGAIETLRNR